MVPWTDARLLPLLLGSLLTLACGDDAETDAGGDDGPAQTTTAGTTSNGGTSVGSTNGEGGTTSGGTGTSATTSDATSTDSQGRTTTAADSSTGDPPMGTMVDSCEECAPQELCMILTEYAGPADGGPPPMTHFCFPMPAACEMGVDCRCAGHLCPGGEEGVEADCSAIDDVLQCSIAYP